MQITLQQRFKQFFGTQQKQYYTMQESTSKLQHVNVNNQLFNVNSKYPSDKSDIKRQYPIA